MPESLLPLERVVLSWCSQPIATCQHCGRVATAEQLAATETPSLCPVCRADLGVLVRAHLHQCVDVATRRAGDVVREPQSTGTARRHPYECPICARHIEPGEPVSFQRGSLLHLACYEVSGSAARSR